MRLGATGSTYRIVNHVVVHSFDLLSALIGGGVVLLGVLIAEVFVRVRERRRRLDEAAWALMGIRGDPFENRVKGMNAGETADFYHSFMEQLGRLRSDARWPLENAREVRSEVDAVATRLVLSMAKFSAKEAAQPPEVSSIVGPKIIPLVLHNAFPIGGVGEALAAEGLDLPDDDPETS